MIISGACGDGGAEGQSVIKVRTGAVPVLQAAISHIITARALRHE